MTTIRNITFLAVCLSVLNAVYGNFFLRQTGDIVIGLILPLHKASNGTACAQLDLAKVIEVEALLYTINQTNSNLRVGYDVVDACAPSNFDSATDTWFGTRSHSTASSAPVAVITDLNDQNAFFDVVKRAKIFTTLTEVTVPVMSVERRSNIWANSYTLKPGLKTSYKALVNLVKYFRWNILDALVYKEYEEFRRFQRISEDDSICLLDEFLVLDWDTAGPNDWLKRSKGNASVAVVFSSPDDVDRLLKLARHDGSVEEFILGWEITGYKDTWDDSLRGLLGIRQDPGDLHGFEVHLETSRLVDRWFDNTSCLEVNDCEYSGDKSSIIERLSWRGAAIIDAAYAVIKAEKTSSNRLQKTGLSRVNVESLTGRVVSFDPERNLAEVNYEILNFQGGFRDVKAVKVGEIGISKNIEMFVRKSDIVWRGSGEPRSKCSADCPPGAKRVAWDESSEKCCWDCVPCPLETVSPYANSTRCLKCPAGSKPTADQTKCQPIYVDYLRWHEPFSLVMIFLLTFTICFLIYTVNLYVKKAHTPVIASSKCASLPLLLSLFVTFVLPVLLLMKPTESSCGAYAAIFAFGLGIPLTFMVVRSHAVHNFCYNNETGELRRKWFQFNPQTIISLILIILLLIFVVTFLSVFPPEVLVFPRNNTHIDYIECSVHSRPRFLPYVFCILALVLAFNVLHVNEVSSEETHQEAKYLSLNMYLMYIYMFVYFVAVYAIEGKKKMRVICIMAYLIGLNFLATIFLPKIFIILFRPEKNKAEAPLLLQENEGENDAQENAVDAGSPELSSGHYQYTEV